MPDGVRDDDHAPENAAEGVLRTALAVWLAFALRLARIARELIPVSASFPPPWLLRPPFTVGMSVLRTVLIAGALVIVAQYFRSARVKAWAGFQDEAPR